MVRPSGGLNLKKAAKVELDMQPTTDVIFGMEFLFHAAKAAECV